MKRIRIFSILLILSIILCACNKENAKAKAPGSTEPDLIAPYESGSYTLPETIEFHEYKLVKNDVPERMLAEIVNHDIDCKLKGDDELGQLVIYHLLDNEADRKSFYINQVIDDEVVSFIRYNEEAKELYIDRIRVDLDDLLPDIQSPPPPKGTKSQKASLQCSGAFLHLANNDCAPKANREKRPKKKAPTEVEDYSKDKNTS